MSGNRTNLGSLSAGIAQYDVTAVASPGTSLADNPGIYSVTSAAGTDRIVLPEGRVGEVYWFESGANGVSLQTSDPLTIAINGGTGADAVSAVGADTLVRLFKSTPTTWIGTNFSSAGVVAATAVAA